MASTTINSGYIGTGITLPGDYTLSNTAIGTITNAGVAVFGVAGTPPDTVVNAGSIAGGTGAGISLLSGGLVTNQTLATIGGAVGVGITGAAGTVVNRGGVTGTGSGIRLEGGGSLDNQAGGTIVAGYRGMVLGGGPGYVTNSGFISASATGIVLYGTGGTAANRQGGMIVAGADGIYVSAGTATNQGTITATRHGIFMNAGANVTNLTGGVVNGGQNGVEVSGGGVVVNAAGGSITGRYIGVDIHDASSTVTNAGTIGATDPGTTLAVSFGVGTTNRLIVSPGAVFNGGVNGGNTIGGASISTLEFASGAGTGTVSGIGTKYIGFAAVTIDAGASWIATGSNAIAAGATLTNNGTLANAGLLDASAGVFIDNASVANSGSIAASVLMTGGARLSNDVTGTLQGGIYAAIGGAARTVVNAGTISAASGVAVINMQSDGTVSNASGGTISGIRGVDISGTASIGNQGLILATGASGTSGSAVVLRRDGTVGNDAGATISGQFYGVVFGTGAGSVTNGGSIHGGGVIGVALNHGGGVSNLAGGTITGHYDGITMTGVAGTAANAGYVGADAGTGIAFGAGGSVINLAGGAVSGAGIGVLIATAAGTVFNAGGITGSTGVALTAGGTIVNAPSGLISGYGGVAVTGGAGTVVNQGGIIAGGPRAVTLAAGYTNLVAVAPGGAFSGLVDGGNTIGGVSVSTLEFASGASTGTLAGLGTQFINFAQLVLDTAASWDLTGTNSIAGGVTLTSGGTLTIPGALSNDGIVQLAGGTLVAGALNGAGAIDMGAGDNLLSLGGSSTETIGGFDQGDTLDLPNLVFSAGATALVSGGTLTVSSGGGGDVFAVSGIADGTSFVVTGDSGTGTEVVACYAEGTRIATERGEIAVETLRVGDRVRTVSSGGLQPVIWLGHRHVNCARHNAPEKVWPVRVAAHAFGPGLPVRDLFLSPDHAVYVNEVLIPVGRLINGTTIRQSRVAAVSYWHIELPRHDVLLAEGLPAESYLETGGRSGFANGGASIMLHPDHSARMWEAAGCAPLIVHGPVLETVRAMVNGMAAMAGAVSMVAPVSMVA